MQTKRYKPLLDKMFWIILIPTLLLLTIATSVSYFGPFALLITIPIDLFTVYFLITPLFGYIELRENSVFIKYGIIMKKEIPYNTIRAVTKERKLYADGLVSLKCSLDHVNIKYNSFDVTSVSVVNNDDFIKALEDKMCEVKS